MMLFFLLIFTCHLGFVNFQSKGKDIKTNKKEAYSHCVTHDEMQLYALINNYRKQQRLSKIPLSSSLSYVARQHCIDLSENIKDLTHSWSSCDYNNRDKDSYYCMWLKPSEMTNYLAYGYECLYANFGGKITAEEALSAWKKSPNHNNVIINKGIWTKIKWRALGVGIYKGYAAIWFGEDTDLEETPKICP